VVRPGLFNRVPFVEDRSALAADPFVPGAAQAWSNERAGQTRQRFK